MIPGPRAFLRFEMFDELLWGVILKELHLGD
jgi:hypothetical protein